jgi:hypothetical protein
MAHEESVRLEPQDAQFADDLQVARSDLHRYRAAAVSDLSLETTADSDAQPEGAVNPSQEEAGKPGKQDGWPEPSWEDGDQSIPM